jgi:hypothetical protein
MLMEKQKTGRGAMDIMTRLMVIAFTVQLSGCAYMFHGNTDQITIQSADSDAQLYLNNVLIGKGSAAATVHRNQKQTIAAKRQGCTDHMVETGDRFDGISLLGLLLDFGIISMLIVDNGTGAMWKTDPLIYHVNPICLSKTSGTGTGSEVSPTDAAPQTTSKPAVKVKDPETK